MPLSDEQIEAIKTRAEAATPGPWKWWTSNSWNRLKRDDGDVTQNVAEPFVSRSDSHPDISISEEDMAFISHARTDIPALLSALEAEKKRADEAEQKRKCFECDSELMACALCNPELTSVELTRLRARVVELERAATFLLSEIDAHQDYDSIVEATSGIRTAIKGDGQ